MSIEVLWLVLAVALVCVGVAGSVLPALPGVPLVFAGLLVAAWAGDFERVGWVTLVVLGLLTVASFTIDLAATAMGAKRVGATKLAVVGAALGTLGGLFLGPAVQKYAFDAWWTGWPNGTDLTDNKTALATLAWLPATLLALRNRPLRAAVIVGWLVMMGVFLIPHSFRGSQIDWSSHPASPPVVEQGP